MNDSLSLPNLLVAFEAGLELALDEIADALLLPADTLAIGELLLLGAGVVHRRFPGHFEREAVAVLGGLERGRILAGDVAGDRHGFVSQLRDRDRIIHQADRGGGPAVEAAP